MEELICKNCGSNEFAQDNGYMICSYCGSRFTITKEKNHHVILSHSNVNSSIALDDDVARLLEKCKTDPRNARKYANLVLDIDPDNVEAMKYLRR